MNKQLEYSRISAIYTLLEIDMGEYTQQLI